MENIFDLPINENIEFYFFLGKTSNLVPYSEKMTENCYDKERKVEMTRI